MTVGGRVDKTAVLAVVGCAVSCAAAAWVIWALTVRATSVIRSSVGVADTDAPG